MFHTYADAEQYVPPALLSPGGKCWRWVELSITIPCFFLSFVVVSGEASVRLQYLCLQSADVVNLLAASGAPVRDVRVGFLNPRYLNGTFSYEFGYLKQIWRYQDGTEVFHMQDGTKIGEAPSDPKRPIGRELVLAV